MIAVTLISCGRTQLIEPVLPGPVACAPAMGLVKLGSTRFSIVSSMVAAGDDLYVSSHERFIPMKYRSPGAVERFAACLPSQATSVLAGEDHPGMLQASALWVHWATADHNAGGESLGVIVRSRSRTSTALISRRLEPRASSVAGPVLSTDGLLWVIQAGTKRELQSVREAQEPFVTVTQLATDSGGNELHRAGARLLWIARKNPDATVSVLNATGQATALWQTRYDIVVLGVENEQLYYQEYDLISGRNQVLRRGLEAAAVAEVVFVPTVRATRGVVSPGEVFVVENEQLVRVTLATGLTRVLWSRATPNEEITALTVDRGRLLFAVANPFDDSVKATLWALDL